MVRFLLKKPEYIINLLNHLKRLQNSLNFRKLTLFLGAKHTISVNYFNCCILLFSTDGCLDYRQRTLADNHSFGVQAVEMNHTVIMICNLMT